MFAPNEYQLLDFGEGRKLERFGAVVLDRPAPAATGPIQDSERWAAATARYERTTGNRGAWRAVVAASQLPVGWSVRHGGTVLELKLTPFGHLGVFPEQAANWDWIAERVAAAGRGIRVLNLFAYTGASTLAAAGAGAEVVHVDAARNILAWARRNAELSGLGGAPVRWICEDAVTFVRRELKRGNPYHAVILDPPSYGHGAKGDVWKLAEHLPSLLADCARLTASNRSFVLLSCHTPGFGPEALAAMLADAFDGDDMESAEMRVTALSGRVLVSGAMARSR
ncbi:MAG TPA: class I SAM-dependent methyltransferase [Pirellulales bacterium]|nr:class I SAM-dependent methyltransferase [Pirellulales bacterium]HVA47598.1 class I SAM-dependent methyltransferase [Pirellulales bacterium]